MECVLCYQLSIYYGNTMRMFLLIVIGLLSKDRKFSFLLFYGSVASIIRNLRFYHSIALGIPVTSTLQIITKLLIAHYLLVAMMC